MLTADVASCYRSIYTHSIPWALRSKAWAKVNRKDTDWENLLDTVVRHERNNQTNGIPIGPDTSLLVAEVVLTAADKAFAAQRIRCKGFRFVDDFELVCESRSQAEDALVALQRALKEIELDLNPTKCSIDELPAAVERTAWSNTLRLWPFENKTKSKLATELIGYFDTAFRLAKANKGQPVLRYAIPRLNSDDIDIDRSNWTLYQDLLLQCAVAEPGSLFEVLRQFFRCQTKGFKIRQGVTSDVLNHHIAFHAPLMNASEVAWALFGLIALGSKIGRRAAAALSMVDDSVVALLTLDARSRGLTPATMSVDRWLPYMDTDGLRGNHWLLSYEANVKGWLPSIGGVDHVQADPEFRELKAAGVSFYDQTLAAPLKPSAVPMSAGGGGAFTWYVI